VHLCDILVDACMNGSSKSIESIESIPRMLKYSLMKKKRTAVQQFAFFIMGIVITALQLLNPNRSLDTVG